MPIEHHHTLLLDPEGWQYRIFDTDTKRRGLRSPDTHIKLNWLDLWQRTVGKYSQRKFKDPTDKLPAIAGLAATFEKRIKSGYLAGLWMDNLAEGLLWMTIGPFTRSDRSAQKQYIAPSWSWASSATPIVYNYFPWFTFQRPIRFLDSNIQWAGTNQKVKPASGSLKVRVLAKALSGTSRERRESEWHERYFYD
jgi:hypothetical protein